ncbi:MAG: mycofactocin biosynthesis peptidyl-dipeptidase MftE [Solirubrobacterales bacterium]|nr:mycofactocin biosynthesis peptidyl-dipeptidase MftE [Solirubrobacterales bacterium]
MRRLADASWQEAERGGILVVPLGATEQHGPHLPLGTDTAIATALVDRLGAARPAAWLVPAIAIGASGEHADFPGTLSFGSRALTTALIELGRSADHFDGLYFVNWHGGNTAAVHHAVAALADEGRRVADWQPSPGDLAGNVDWDLHAGRLETSLMLAIDPKSVRPDLAAAGSGARTSRTLDRLREEGVRAVSPSGVLGDPCGATAEEGGRLLDLLSADLVASYDAFATGLE